MRAAEIFLQVSTLRGERSLPHQDGCQRCGEENGNNPTRRPQPLSRPERNSHDSEYQAVTTPAQRLPPALGATFVLASPFTYECTWEP